MHWADGITKALDVSEIELPRGVADQNKTDDASLPVIGGLASQFYFNQN